MPDEIAAMNQQPVLQTDQPLIAPSMLKCDFANLARELSLLETAGADLLHWDVMDGHFVPNLTYGAPVIKSCRDLTRIPFEAHLMISDPARYWRDYADAGCEIITFHVEAVTDPRPLLEEIRQAGIMAGLSLNPKTPCERIEPYLDLCDLVLVMTVEPGFGGQKFIENCVSKIEWLAQRLSPHTQLAVDGGIGRSTIEKAAEAGANLFVAGSAVFDSSDYRSAIDELRRLAGTTKAGNV